MIEALYRPASHFLWAVQWHPEFLYKVDPRSQTILMRLWGVADNNKRGCSGFPEQPFFSGSSQQTDLVIGAGLPTLIGACGDRRPKAKAHEGTSNLRKGGIRSANQCWLLRRWYISDSSSSFSNWRAVVFSSMTASSTPAMRAKSSQASRPTEVVMQVW